MPEFVIPYTNIKAFFDSVNNSSMLCLHTFSYISLFFVWVQKISVKSYLNLDCFEGVFLSCTGVKSTTNVLQLFSTLKLSIDEYNVLFGRILQYDLTLPFVLKGVSLWEWFFAFGFQLFLHYYLEKKEIYFRSH